MDENNYWICYNNFDNKLDFKANGRSSKKLKGLYLTKQVKRGSKFQQLQTEIDELSILTLTIDRIEDINNNWIFFAYKYFDGVIIPTSLIQECKTKYFVLSDSLEDVGMEFIESVQRYITILMFDVETLVLWNLQQCRFKTENCLM